MPRLLFCEAWQAMGKIKLLQNSLLVMIHDLAWIPLAVWLAFWLRFNLDVIPVEYVRPLQVLIIISLPLQAVTFWFFGLYRGIWRFASIPDLLRILKAVLIGALLCFIALFVWQRMEGIPRSVLLLYPSILIIGLAVPRLVYRWLKDRNLNITTFSRKRALLVGAGQAGELLVRDLLKNGPYQPVGFLDDSQRRQGQEIHGVRVVGSLSTIEKTIQNFGVEVVLLAMPSAPHQVIQSVLSKCQKHAIPCRTLPSVSDLADGKVEVSRLRKVQIEDLLGREAVELDQSGIHDLLAAQVVLVTGAGGSIGSELCRQVLRYNPTKLILLDHGEFNLYTIDKELSSVGTADHVKMHAVLGDIRDVSRMRWLFEHFRPDVVFNAAAYKHVPLVEGNPAEGVKTNVLGTCQIADLAVEFGVKKFLQVSTDKAVNPTNVMGTTKRTAEIYCQNLNLRTDSTAFVTTRFGNVLGSAGSVVPLFRSQIEAGGPITVTHPEITRYFMTIPEAVSLILQAATMGQGGEIFVLDMGEPVKVVELAEQMIRLTGFEPGRDIEIQFTGLRPGEKLYEELFHESEVLQPTSHPKILLSASREVDWQQIQHVLVNLGESCASRDVNRLYRELKVLVPEFVSDSLEKSHGKAISDISS
ncbi:UDP-N-acetyl-alpha-D-glucosamine C6 dehydratase [Mariprofundus micogutta]|uniref:UDP-N-acetyl-alpha-D-glucosamine C6 dehydratase n=1 Tax=Mariprofundus micogutta TaxID=1921010 RepID=A0A1L8CLN7_9PROT|nr:nucleoside-diphosphate sugar epimerase/dehydratase [Mariprofundus micogutta]GAV19759.1 UDP-N-acetyl-alpha-D-glucosamine C6 dehydratase [Mariprofundus micogutta]